MFRIFTVAATLLIASLSPVGAAAPLTRSAVYMTDEGTRYQMVRFSDLNLASDEGNQRLYRRLARAADAVCEQNSPMRPTFKSDVARCRKAALARAVMAIGRASLTALHVSESTRRRAGG